MQTTSTMTADEIHNWMREVTAALAEKLTVHVVGVINDYPIGGSNRGMCKLEVEYKKGNMEWRTVRTTTDKRGRWCSPKKSTYRFGSGYVVSGDIAGIREIGWLSINLDGVYVQSANGTTTSVIKTPFSTQPRLRATTWRIGNDVRHYEADPPEILEAWAAWTFGLKDIDGMLKSKFDAAVRDEQELDDAVRSVVSGGAA